CRLRKKQGEQAVVQGVGKSRVKVTRFDLPQALRSVVSVVCYLLMATQRKLSCRVFRCFSGGWLQSSVLSGSQPIASGLARLLTSRSGRCLCSIRGFLLWS